MKLNLLHPQITMLILAWFVADILGPLVIRLAEKMSACDKPHGYKAHEKPVPYLGGFLILIGFSAALASVLQFDAFEPYFHLFAMLGCSLIMLIMGLADDIFHISALIKLLITFVVVWLCAQAGVRITISNIQPVDLLLTLMWVAGVTSAFNSVDNMNGAAAGTAAISAFWTFYIAWHTPPYGQRDVTFFAISIAGACLGFLRYNFPTGRMFLGNNGAFLIGFLISTMMVMTGWATDDPVKAIVVPCAILVVPLYDITVSTILRIVNGVVKNPIDAILYCGRDHVSHRLEALGYSKRGAVLMMYSASIIGGLIASIIHIPFVGPEIYYPLTGISLIFLVVSAIYLNRAQVYKSDG